jgi:hypothetical protein
MTVHRLIEFTAALPGDIIILNGRRDADVPFEGPGLTHQISVESVTQGEEIIVPNGPCGDTGLYPTIIRSTDGEEFASVATVLRGDPAEGDYRAVYPWPKVTLVVHDDHEALRQDLEMVRSGYFNGFTRDVTPREDALHRLLDLAAQTLAGRDGGAAASGRSGITHSITHPQESTRP